MIITTILSWRPDNGHCLSREFRDLSCIDTELKFFIERILGRKSNQINKIFESLKNRFQPDYGIYHSIDHLFKVTICFIALKNYLREEIKEEEIIAALLHDYRYTRAQQASSRFGITVEEASVNIAFDDELFANYSQFMTVRDLIMETVPHKDFKIVKHPLQVADLMPSYGLCVDSARSESEKIVEEITEGSGGLTPKDCFDNYGKTFCFGMKELNEQKILLHRSTFD